MEIERLYNKLHNDVYSHFYPDVYLLNQEGDINQFNTFQKKRWKYYKDGGRVIKGTKDYYCNYSFDFKDNVFPFTKSLSFRSYNKSAGLNLLNFVNSVLNGNPEILVKVDNLITHDARKHLLEVVHFSIRDSVIDEMFFKVLKRYFHKIEKISFTNCVIKKECNLNSINADIDFDETIIESSRSLNNCTASLYIIRSSINQITPTTVKSKNLTIACLSPEHYVDLKMLFLKCNFPDLISFDVSPEITYDTYSFEDAFIYLPDSAPNLEEITIKGKVRDLNFLTKFKYLISCGIFSIYDDMGLEYAEITDRKERKKIFERNRYQYEVQKILFPNLEDKFIIANLEEERILRLCNFLSTLSYTEEDKQIFKEKDTIKALLAKDIDPNVTYYYEYYYDTLHPKRQLSAIESRLNCENMYRFFDNYLCVFDPTKILFEKDKKQLLQVKPFLFALNGMPIIFNEKMKPPRTIEAAKKRMAGVQNTGFNLDDYNYKEFVKFLKEYSKKMDQEISVGELTDMIEEQIGYSVSSKDFLAFGPVGKRISYAFDTSKRYRIRMGDICRKVDGYKKLLANTIRDNYETFTIEEKAYMYYDKFDMNIAESKKEMERFQSFYASLVTDEESTLESINLKTKGLYSKYRNYISGFTELTYSLGNPYDSASIKPKDMKQLVFHS